MMKRSWEDAASEYVYTSLFGIAVVFLGPALLMFMVLAAPFWVIGKGVEWVSESWTKQS